METRSAPGRVCAASLYLFGFQARALVLGGMASADRAAALMGMSEDEAAAVLVVMSPAARTRALDDMRDMDPTLVTCTVHHIRSVPFL